MISASLCRYYTAVVNLSGPSALHNQLPKTIRASQGDFKDYVYAAITYAQHVFKGSVLVQAFVEF